MRRRTCILQALTDHLKHPDGKALISATCMTWSLFSLIFLKITDNFLILLPLLIVIFGITYVFSLVAIKFIKSKRVTERSEISFKRKLLVFTLGSIIAFGVMMLWYIAYYPGMFSNDSIGQYSQVVSGNYIDWHPAWHTLAFFTFPLKLTGKTGSVILFQIIYFSILIGYMALTIYELCGPIATVVSVLLTVLNPFADHLLLIPWKDSGFAICCAFSTIFVIRIIYKKKDKISIWKALVFGLLFASATILRHNGILFTGPLLLGLILNTKRSVWLKMGLTTLLFIFLIRVPLYRAFNVHKPDQRVIETTGLPLNIIANVAKEDPESMDEELADFVYSMADKDVWENKYPLGDFNVVKHIDEMNLDPVEEKGTFGMLRLTLKCFRCSPKASFRAFLATTYQVYGIDYHMQNDYYDEFWCFPTPYNTQFVDEEGGTLRRILEAYSMVTALLRPLRTYGTTSLIMLFFILSAMDLRSLESWKKALVLMPAFIYNLGTMLFLTAPDSRFFYSTTLVAPVVICYSLYLKMSH